MVCDDCLTAAWDEGAEDRPAMVALMTAMGDQLTDHSCQRVEDPVLRCDCACERAQ